MEAGSQELALALGTSTALRRRGVSRRWSSREGGSSHLERGMRLRARKFAAPSPEELEVGGTKEGCSQIKGQTTSLGLQVHCREEEDGALPVTHVEGPGCPSAYVATLTGCMVLMVSLLGDEAKPPA